MVPEMRLGTAIMIGAFALAACGGSSKPAPATSTTTSGGADKMPAAAGVPCEQEIALECPAGQTDGCLKSPAEGTTHACVPQ